MKLTTKIAAILASAALFGGAAFADDFTSDFGSTDAAADAGAQKETAGLPRPFRCCDGTMDQNLYFTVSRACQREITRCGLV